MRGPIEGGRLTQRFNVHVVHVKEPLVVGEKSRIEEPLPRKKFAPITPSFYFFFQKSPNIWLGCVS